MSMFDELMAFAMPIDTEKMTSPTASSRATIGRSRSVSFPFALYWRTTMSVAAGAVADAMAPRVRASGTVTLPPAITWRSRSAASTSKVAATD